jgi:hypothetical protein
MEAAAHWEQMTAARIRPYKWILCADAAAAFTPYLSMFGEMGAPRPLLLAGSPGTGDQPDPDLAEVVILGTEGDTMLGGIRAYHDALRDLPDWALERIEEWDPEGEARILASFLDTDFEIGGRRTWGARPIEWLALEDKTVIDAVWDAAGVDRAPSQVVDAERAALVGAARRLDGGSGTVWTADNREGWHGGAEYSRVVRDPENAASAIEFMEAKANRVRVMPFLEGVPCAIHGLVFPDAVATFRPAEMQVFRVPDGDVLRYGGAATTWDPAPERREEMRSIARTVGAHLRETADFRGAFTIDGVLTADGFRPTELNPRYGAGIGVIGRTSGAPLLGISRMLIAGEEADYRPAELEEVVVAAADETRFLGGITPVWHKVAETTERRLQIGADGSVARADDGEGNATLAVGPAAHGGVIRFRVDDGEAPKGPQGAPIMADAIAIADEDWDTGIGELIPATPV